MDIVQQVLRSPESEKYIAQHGLGGYFFRHLGEGERSPYERSYLQTWHLNEIYLREYNFLREKALTAGVLCEGLKGIYLLNAVYGDLGLRRMSDIDILTDSETVLAHILEEKGYRKIDCTEYKTTYSRLVDGNEVAFEIHSRLYDDKTIVPEIEQKHLTIEEHFYFLVYHLGYQHTYLRLNWFIDLYMFLSKYNLDINQILKMARERNQEKAFLITLYFYNNFFGTHYPSRKPLLADRFDFNFFIEPQKNWMSYQLLKHQTKQSYLDAFKYDLNWLLKKLRRE